MIAGPSKIRKKSRRLSFRTFLWGLSCAVTSLWCSVVLLVFTRIHHGGEDVADSSSSLLKAAPSVFGNKNASNKPVTIAHAVSLITCSGSQKASVVQGLLDALVILRHSIHRNSIHNNNPNSSHNSKYSYQMFAMVHEDGGCAAHVPLLEQLGYIPLVRPTPVNISAITGNDWYRAHVQQENCCGAAEFVKLYAYTLTEYPIAVHWDLDACVLQPLDDLWDAMLYDKNSAMGRAARQRLQLQNPTTTTTLPDRIDAFFTRDVTSARPWETVRAVQGGFVVARPSVEHFDAYRQFILQANYTPGRGPNSGWGGMGYGGFQGKFSYIVRSCHWCC